MSTSEQRRHVVCTALGFRIGKRVTDHCSILVPEDVDFSQELLQR